MIHIANTAIMFSLARNTVEMKASVKSSPLRSSTLSNSCRQQVVRTQSRLEQICHLSQTE